MESDIDTIRTSVRYIPLVFDRSGRIGALNLIEPLKEADN